MYKNYLKRSIDFTIALIAAPFTLLIILIMAPIIYFSNPGPIFYNAPRKGKNRNIFKMFKLRSMYVDVPDLRNEDGSTFNSDIDQRVMPIGRIMRKTSIDEIPQIFNVLLGDMSFVGPRPTLPSETRDELECKYEKRFSIRPGITGYSQAYYRNSVSREEKFKQDVFYAEHVSFLLDLKIIVKTILSVIKRENIYSSATKVSEK